MRVGKLFRPGQVEPDLEEFEGVFFVAMRQWKHFAMLQTGAGSHPLHIAIAIAPRSTMRIKNDRPQPLTTMVTRFETPDEGGRETPGLSYRDTCANRLWG